MGKEMGNECMFVVVWLLKHKNCLCCLKLPKVVSLGKSGNFTA